MLEELDYFLYELNIYKIFCKEKRCELIYSKFYKSGNELPTKIKVDYFPNKKKPEIIYEKSFNLIGAPKDYIEKLPRPKEKKKHEKRNRTVRNRKV